VIPGVDLLLRTVLDRAAGTPQTLIGFQPPDGRWSQRVHNFRVNGNAVTCLSAFLADLRENRTLRTDAVAREINNGLVTVVHAPLRVDLHYLISAWHPTEDSNAVPATMFEHALLSRVLAELAATPLNSDLLLTATQAASLPEMMQSVDLPMKLLPIEGFPHLGEFWASMGQGQSWRPACYVVVTMPVAPEPHEAGGIVETILASIAGSAGPYAVPLANEGVLVIGGVVRSATGPAPWASVDLFGLPGGPADGRLQTTIADDDGRFTFAGLEPGTYNLVFSHPTHPTPPPVPVTLPLASGHVDLVFP
jgi:Pvc16 N-terminal domain/Carboxypeptidase regulatory-like domain